MGDGVTLDATELGPQPCGRWCRPRPSDDARPILTGVLVTAEADGLRLVATDSYRLAVRDLPGQSVLAEGQSVLVPPRALNDLTKVLSGVGELTLRLGERDAKLRGRRRAPDHDADRRRLPQLQGAHPLGAPEPAHGQS